MHCSLVKKLNFREVSELAQEHTDCRNNGGDPTLVNPTLLALCSEARLSGPCISPRMQFALILQLMWPSRLRYPSFADEERTSEWKRNPGQGQTFRSHGAILGKEYTSKKGMLAGLVRGKTQISPVGCQS